MLNIIACAYWIFAFFLLQKCLFESFVHLLIELLVPSKNFSYFRYKAFNRCVIFFIFFRQGFSV